MYLLYGSLGFSGAHSHVMGMLLLLDRYNKATCASFLSSSKPNRLENLFYHPIYGNQENVHVPTIYPQCIQGKFNIKNLIIASPNQKDNSAICKSRIQGSFNHIQSFKYSTGSTGNGHERINTNDPIS